MNGPLKFFEAAHVALRTLLAFSQPVIVFLTATWYHLGTQAILRKVPNKFFSYDFLSLLN